MDSTARGMTGGRRGAAAVLIAVLSVVACSSGSGVPRAAPASTGAPDTTPATTTVAEAATTTTGPGSAAGPCGAAAGAPSRYEHVVWVWMENHQWAQVLGDARSAPYESALAAGCGTATAYASVGSPSLPNYLGATSGATWGIHDDADPPLHPLPVDNVFRQVRQAGGTARSYEEAMTAPCRLTASGRYAPKHNPAAYYTGGDDRAACRTDDVDLAQFSADLAAGRLPTFAFVTPDLCHDTHDCPVATGDAWLAGWLPALLSSPAYRGGTTAVFVVWDEYTPMPNVVVAPTVPAHTVVATRVDHFALLRTTEELLGLPLLGRAANATSLRGPFRM